MINFLWASVSIILISLIISLRCEDGYEALHFTRNIPRKAIDKVMNKHLDNPPLMYPTATACSAKSRNEDAFNEKTTLGRNSLFVRNTYEANQTSMDVDYKTCENPTTLSVLYHTKDVEFVFGFEIYYDKSQFGDKGFVESKRGDYDLITNTHAYTNYIKALLPYIPVLSRIPYIPGVSRLLLKSLYLDDERKQQMGFLWLDAFRMKFDFQAQRVSYALYGLSMTNRGRRKCANYDLGKEFFNGFDLKNLYLPENQKRMLTGVKFPQSESGDNYEEVECESENQCFAKWSLVPAELFHHLVTEPTSCSDLLTVPVWKSTIYDVLTKLDNFLFALSTVIGHPLGEITVHSGVHGVLQLPTDSDEWRMKPITLTEKGTQIPDVIYKLIKYTIKTYVAPKNISKNDESKPTESEPADNDKKGEWRFAEAAIIVIIHNNPNFDPEKDRICKDECETLGWEIIKQKKLSDEEIIESKYIYCCQANDSNVKEKLKLNYELSDDPRVHYTSGKFSLKAVPLFNMDTKVFELHDAHDFVVKVYKHLFEGAKLQRINSNDWDTFMINHHVKTMHVPRVDTTYLLIEAPKNDHIEPDNDDEEPAVKEEIDKSNSKDAELGDKK